MKYTYIIIITLECALHWKSTWSFIFASDSYNGHHEWLWY